MFIIISAIYTILSIITNNKKTYSSYSYIVIMLSIITNIIDESLISAIILIFINSILLATSANYEEKYLKLPIYITFLTSIFVPISCQGLLIDNPYLTTLLFIWILVIIIITSQERTIKITSYFYIIFPILKLIYLKDLSTEVSTISTSILILYITYLIQEFLCKENSSKVLTIIIGVLASLTIPGIFFLNKLTILIRTNAAKTPDNNPTPNFCPIPTSDQGKLIFSFTSILLKRPSAMYLTSFSSAGMIRCLRTNIPFSFDTILSGEGSKHINVPNLHTNLPLCVQIYISDVYLPSVISLFLKANFSFMVGRLSI